MCSVVHTININTNKIIFSARYAAANPRALCATVLDQSGRPQPGLTYAKLASRSHKVAHLLLGKLSSSAHGGPGLRLGDCVALVYPNSDPLAFMVAWFGCQLAGVVPVPIQVTFRFDTDIVTGKAVL